jgi:hypothetical protein
MQTVVTRRALTGDRQHAADWHSAEQRRDGLALVQIEGRYRSARRCIDPPSLDMSVVEGATSYVVVVAPAGSPEVAWHVRSDEPAIDLSPLWHQLPYGPLRLTPRACDAAGQVIAIW